MFFLLGFNFFLFLTCSSNIKILKSLQKIPNFIDQSKNVEKDSIGFFYFALIKKQDQKSFRKFAQKKIDKIILLNLFKSKNQDKTFSILGSSLSNLYSLLINKQYIIKQN